MRVAIFETAFLCGIVGTVVGSVQMLHVQTLASTRDQEGRTLQEYYPHCRKCGAAAIYNWKHNCYDCTACD